MGPILEGSNLMQMYGKLEGFPFESAWGPGFIIIWGLKKQQFQICECDHFYTERNIESLPLLYL